MLTGKGKAGGKKTAAVPAADLPAWVDADNVSDADVIGTLSDTAQVIDYSDPDPHSDILALLDPDQLGVKL